MKKNVFLIVFFVFYTSYCIVSCKKNKDEDTVNPITTSYTEEFARNSDLAAKGWLFLNATNFNGEADWSIPECQKGYCPFNAYSYPSGDATEYLMIWRHNSWTDISSWLVTPPLRAENGDRFSFYTTTDPLNSLKEHLEVYLNYNSKVENGGAASTTGNFSPRVFDINPQGGNYPRVWTKYEYIFSGLSGPTNVRVGFRFAPRTENASVVGLDQFKFIKQ